MPFSRLQRSHIHATVVPQVNAPERSQQPPLAGATTKKNQYATTWKRVQVPLQTKLVLNICNDAISIVTELLSYRAANQQWNRARHGIEPEIRVITAEAVDGRDASHPMRLAGAALHVKAGNCAAQAALLYLVLREMLGPDFLIGVAFSKDLKHEIVTVRNQSGSVEVVVDSWPKNAQAMAWGDHFAHLATDLQLRFEKRGLAGCIEPGSKLKKAYGKYCASTIEATLQNLRKHAVQLNLQNLPESDFDVQWCAKHLGGIEYFAEEETAAPLQSDLPEGPAPERDADGDVVMRG